MKLFAISKETIEIIEKHLQRLIKIAKPKCAFLFERSGYIICSKGEFEFLQPEDMGATAAGALAALQNMVNLTNSKEQTITFYNTNVDKIHFAMVTNRVFLAVLYDSETTNKKIRDAVKEFLRIINPYLTSDESKHVTFSSVQYINDKLNELFKDALR